MFSLTAFLLYTAIALVSYLLVLCRRKFNYWQSLGIPCDSPNWIFGTLGGFGTRRSLTKILNDYYTRYRGTGPFAGFYWFQRNAVIVLDTKLAKDVLIKEFHKFTDRGFYANEEDDPLTGQIFLLDGHRWRQMRNKLSPTFTSGKMKMMFPIVTQVGKELLRLMDDMIERDPVVEVKDIMGRFTMDVIGTCAFGLECNSLKDPNTDFVKMSRRSLIDQRHNILIIIFMNGYPELAKRLHMKQTHPEIEEYFLRIVRETVEYREKNKVRRNDFMDMLIDLKNNKSIKTEDGQDLTNITMGQLSAQAFVFLVAGFETSSTTMGFALYELARHQDLQQRAREEIEEVLERHNGEMTYECMNEMEYLNQIISETLRLYTVVPVLNRYALEDYVVPDNPKYVIKKGTMVAIPAAAIHHDPEFYPNPEEFNPDNFTPDKVRERDSVEYLPFGDGPRNCIGMRFGLMQARVGLALLLKNFKFSVCDKTPKELKFNKRAFLLSSESGIYLKVERV